MTYEPAANRYDAMAYRACGRSGLRLPVLSLGLWHNFGDTAPLSAQRELVHAAFDLGITHFDLANNYGPPYGSAEINFGRILREDLAAHRDELLISSKAGWDMWPGPYGTGGGSRKHVLASLDQSLRRVGVDYFDIFYSHRFDADTPLEETAGALATAVRQGKALYIGISLVFGGQDPGDGRTPSRGGRPAADPPALLQPLQPLAGGGADRCAGGRRERDDRVHGAGPGPAERQVPRRHPCRLADQSPGRRFAPAGDAARTTSPGCGR